MAEGQAMLSLEQIVADLAQAIKEVDAGGPRCKDWPPGIGAFPEREMVRMAVEHLRTRHAAYATARVEADYPAAGRARCDLLIPGEWAIEFKQSGIFVSRGMEYDNWSRTLLHPFLGLVDGVAKSLVGDAIKLMCSGFVERKALVLLLFEHDPVDIDAELPLRMFEYGARELMGIPLGARSMAQAQGLIHPHQQQLKVLGWPVGELAERRPCANPEWLDHEVAHLTGITAKAQERRDGLDVTADMTAGELRARFADLYGMTLRVKHGRQVAMDDCRIGSVARKSFTEENLKISAHALVGTIEEQFFSQLGLRVQVEGAGGKLAPNGATMAKVRRKKSASGLA